NRSSFAMMPTSFPGSGDENGAAADLARVQIVEGLLELVQAVPGGVQLHPALGGEDHQVLQVGVGADEVPDEVDLRGDDVDGRDVEVLAVADDVVVPGATQHPHAFGRRSAFADEVDDRLGAVAAGQVEDL